MGSLLSGSPCKLPVYRFSLGLSIPFFSLCFVALIAIIRIGGIQLGEELFQLPKPQKRRKP